MSLEALSPSYIQVTEVTKRLPPCCIQVTRATEILYPHSSLTFKVVPLNNS